MTVVLNTDIAGFFRERLLAALGRQELVIADSTEFYLINLLTERSAQASDALDRSLVERLAAAIEATSLTERFRHYRDMGDAALYSCGFFADHLERRGVSRDYVVTMGGRAYQAAGEIATRAFGPSDTGFAEAYPELADKFERFALVLDEVRETTTMRTPQEIVRLYERWKKTKSPLLAERLAAEGVYLQGMPKPVLH